MNRMNSLLASLALLGCGLLGCGLIYGQEANDSEISLPQDPRVWINSPPVSVEAMRGKAIVLYFFEEGCPRCRAKWPEILAAANANASNPVMLIAVNSGSSPAEVSRYVKQHGINVPVIMDVDRSLERAAGVNEVSLQNIWQARVVGPDGELKRANGGDIPGTLRLAADAASWNVDPSSMPAQVIPTWRQVEFGNFASASKMIARFVRDRKPEVKAAGEALQSYVREQMDLAVAEAEQADDSSDLWKAFRIYEAIMTRFAGYEVPGAVEQRWQTLKRDESIEQQIDAMKLWQIIERTVQSGRASPGRVTAMMEKIIEKYPGTEAASRAQAAMSSRVDNSDD